MRSERWTAWTGSTTRRRRTSGYDDEEFDPGMLGVKKTVLSQYDVDIESAQDDVRFPFSTSDGRSAWISEADHLFFDYCRCFDSEVHPFPPKGPTWPSLTRIGSPTSTEGFWRVASATRVSCAIRRMFFFFFFSLLTITEPFLFAL
jgi:hypothetical protein